MLSKVRNEKGFALAMVLFAMIILGATVVVISSAMRTKGHITSMVRGTGVALAQAEDGINIGIAALNSGQSFSNFTIRNGSWITTVSYVTSGTPFIAATASSQDGRYRRTVKMDVTTTGSPGVNIVTENAIYSHGDIRVINGVLNLNGNSFLANERLYTANNTQLSAAKMYYGSEMENPAADLRGNWNGGSTYGHKDGPDAFPQMDFNALTQGAPHVANNAEAILTKLSQMKNTGGILVVDVDSSTVSLSKQGNNLSNIDINPSKPIAVVFRRTGSFQGEYTVGINGDSWQNVNGPLSLIADGGAFHFNNLNFNSRGIVYTNLENPTVNNGLSVQINNSNANNFKARIMAKDNIQVNNANIDFPNNGTNPWDTYQPYFAFSITASNWREVSSSSCS